MILYHGSKNGIQGNIEPQSRRYCDFGKGFYMGTDKMQPLTLICNFPQARFYTLEVDVNEINVLDIELSIEWALFVAYNRGKMEDIKGTPIYEKYQHFADNVDMICGYIANDRMFVVLDRFFAGEITDVALINCLSALKLGKQYVAITQKACQKIQIVEDREISTEERSDLLKLSEANRNEGVIRANEICKKFRRQGRFFDEILEGGI